MFDIARAQYVDKPDDGKLIASAINGMMSSLDPHSNYMDAKSFSEMQADTNGEFGGLGLQVTMQDGLIKVVSPIDGTPAARAGLQANDIITDIDDQPIKGLTLQQAVKKMRGPPASTIRRRSRARAGTSRSKPRSRARSFTSSRYRPASRATISAISAYRSSTPTRGRL